MDSIEMLRRLVEAPVIGLLAVVVLALAWTLTRVLAFLPRLPNAIIEAMSEAGEQSSATFRRTADELQETIHDLQKILHEERERLDEANGEIIEMKRHLMAVDRDRRRALHEREEWKQKAAGLETLAQSLKAQVERLSREVQDLNGRMAA